MKWKPKIFAIRMFLGLGVGLPLLAVGALAGCATKGDGGAAKERPIPRATVCSPGLAVLETLRGGLSGDVAAGIAWGEGGNSIAAGAFSGVKVWNLGRNPSGKAAPSLHFPYKRSGIGRGRPMSPNALIEQGDAFAVSLLVAGHQGARPRMVMDWYSRSNFRFLRSYVIRLADARDMGVQVIAPPRGTWFATLPFDAPSWARIQVWNSQNGSPLPLKLPAIWQVQNSIFCDRAGQEVGWVSSGHYVHFAKLEPTVVSRIRLVSEPVMKGALSPDGRYIFLLTSSDVSNPADVRAILAPRSGAGFEKVINLSNGAFGGHSRFPTAPPVFSPAGNLVAFSFLSVHAKHTFWVDVFIASVHRYQILYRARIPGEVPMALSFSPGGRKLAVVGRRKIFVLGISSPNPGYKPRYWKARLPQHWMTIPPTPVSPPILRNVGE